MNSICCNCGLEENILYKCEDCGSMSCGECSDCGNIFCLECADKLGHYCDFDNEE